MTPQTTLESSQSDDEKVKKALQKMLGSKTAITSPKEFATVLTRSYILKSRDDNTQEFIRDMSMGTPSVFKGARSPAQDRLLSDVIEQKKYILRSMDKLEVLHGGSEEDAKKQKKEFKDAIEHLLDVLNFKQEITKLDECVEDIETCRDNLKTSFYFPTPTYPSEANSNSIWNEFDKEVNELTKPIEEWTAEHLIDPAKDKLEEFRDQVTKIRQAHNIIQRLADSYATVEDGMTLSEFENYLSRETVELLDLASKSELLNYTKPIFVRVQTILGKMSPTTEHHKALRKDIKTIVDQTVALLDTMTK